MLLAATLVPYVGALLNRISGDVQLYEHAATAALSGASLYREVVLEYPPYALPYFIVPKLLWSGDGYRHAFAAEMLGFDIAIKIALLLFGARRWSGWRSFAPFALFSLVGFCLEYLYLKRFDLVPALFSVLLVMAVMRGRFFAAGLFAVVAAATKLYPALWLPWLWFSARQEGEQKALFMGSALGLLPLALLSFVWPWWNFAAFHTGRGLQVESLYASVIWLAHHAGAENIGWFHTAASYDLSGPLSDAVLPWAKGLWAAVVCASVGLSLVRAQKNTDKTPAGIARALLLPLLAFVAFSPILSPQYLIWIIPLAAFTTEATVLIALLAAAMALTPIIFPSPQYAYGIELWRSVVLLARNLLLVSAWAWLVAEKRSAHNKNP